MFLIDLKIIKPYSKLSFGLQKPLKITLSHMNSYFMYFKCTLSGT